MSSFVFAASIAALFMISFSGLYYYLWLVERKFLLRKFFLAILLLFAFTLTMHECMLVVFPTVSNPVLYFTLIVVIFTALMVLRKKFPGCRKEDLIGPYELCGIKYYVCKSTSRIINAWYDGKRIIISKDLLTILNRDELHAVLLHERSHSVNKTLFWFNSLLRAFWLLIMASIVASTTLTVTMPLMFTKPKIMEVVSLYFLIGCILTAPVLAVSWIYEHEADAETLKYSLGDHMVSALVKTMVYQKLYGALEGLLNVEVEATVKRINVKYVPWWRILFEYFKAVVLSTPWSVFKFISRPLYITHPPLWLRAWHISGR
mgnify:CR=1 FL=1